MAEQTMTITITLPQIPLVAPGQARAILRQEVGTAMHGIVGEIATEAKIRTPVFTGILRAAIGTRVTLGTEAGTLAQGEVFTGAQAPYAEYIEEGTRPHWPPRAPLELWAQRKLGDARLWFVVARAIARRGTRAYHMFRDALAQVQPTMQGRMQAAVDRAAARIQGEAH